MGRDGLSRRAGGLGAPARRRGREVVVAAWMCSGEEEHGEKPPVAPAPGAGVPRTRARGLGVVLGLPVEGPVACHGAFVERSWWLRWLVCVAVAYESLPYKGAGWCVWPRRTRACLIKALAARRPTWSSRRRALMSGADGQARHQCLANNALDEAEAATQTRHYRGGEDGSSIVAARWAKGGHQKERADACVDRLPVRVDPFRSHVWIRNGSTEPRLSL
jgi:hypothetical protein